MSRLEDIGVRVEGAAMLTGNSDNARAVLSELEQMLKRLLDEGEESSIDLGGLPLGDEDYALLNEVLGEGEVHAEVDAVGMAEVQESGIPGIWWVLHYNENEEVMAHFLEVTFCPELLSAPIEDVKEGLDALRARLFEVGRGG